MNPGLLLRAILAAVLVPGTVVGLVPYLIVRPTLVPSSFDISIVSILAILTGTAGLALLLACIWRFGLHGKGTLAPVDPPRTLVVQSLYRYTRNPMYVAVTIVLLSEAVLCRSVPVLIYTVIALACFHLFVVLYEEPNLKARFGASYDEYKNAVPRWGIARKPYEGGR